jgi:hypothetical protein
VVPALGETIGQRVKLQVCNAGMRCGGRGYGCG